MTWHPMLGSTSSIPDVCAGQQTRNLFICFTNDLHETKTTLLESVKKKKKKKKITATKFLIKMEQEKLVMKTR